MSGYKTRYAPSPTGAMHLGHARTALVTWLRARREGGSIVMRIEDLDAVRVRRGAAEAICADHEWLELGWDEGPVFQRHRLERYAEAVAELDRRGALFRCTCTRKELAMLASAPHGDEGPAYPGTCRNGPSQPGRPASMRFRMDGPAPGFVDALHGTRPAGATGDDFVVKRSDGLFAYQLAVVVDDHDMGITEVVRGDDLLAATPRQLALHAAFGWSPPSHLHVPLVVGDDGVRLAKRHGAIGVGEHRDAGVSREALLGWLGASLGLLEKARPTSLDELLERFDVARIPKTPVTAPALTSFDGANP